MRHNRDILLKVLSAAKPALAKKEFIEQACHFIFTGDTLATFNDQICILHPYKTDIAFSVQGEEFYKTIDSIKEDEIEISAKDGNVLIDAKRTKAGLSTIIGEQEKIEDRIEDLRRRISGKGFWRKLPEDFVQGIFLCMFSASRDMTQGVRCCVAVKENIVVSTDNLRASKYTMKGNADLMLLAARDCIELVKYPVTRYGKSEGWTHFRTDEGIIFNCRTLEGIYPFEELLIVFKEPDKELIIPKEMQSILQTAVIFATGEVDVDKNVELTIKGDKIICKSQKEKGWLIKEIDIKNIHKISFQFQVNPIFFAQILNKTTKFYMITKHRWPDKAAFATENFRHIITIPTQEEWEGEYAENSNKKKKRIL